MKFRTNELTNKQMIVSIQRAPHSFHSRVIVHRSRSLVGLFKFVLVVFGFCNIYKKSHIAFMEMDQSCDCGWSGLEMFCPQTPTWVDTGGLCCSEEKTRKLCVIPALSPQMIFHCAGDRK